MARYLWHTTAETGHRRRSYRREVSAHLGYLRLFVEDAIEADEWVQIAGEDWYMMADENEKGDVLTAFLWFGPPGTEDPHVIMQVKRAWWWPRLVSDVGGLRSVPTAAAIEAGDLARRIAWAWLEAGP